MAGVPVTTVRYDGVVHDFMLLNAMSEAKATRAAIAQATAFLREALGTAPHNALDVGPETGRMLSTYIVEAGEPLAAFTR
jgi:hypothetical protein